jgi:starch-binding outer membrane protein, SusD/RagB family
MNSFKRYIVILISGLFIHSCAKDYLNKDPLGQLDEAAVANKRGVEKLLIGAYSMLDGIRGSRDQFESRPYYAGAASNWIFGSICGSEAYKGSFENDQAEITSLEKFEGNPSHDAFGVKWSVVYDGVQRANDVLRIMKKATDILPDDQKRIAAEARFLRAHYHFEAKKMWNKVPYIDESITYGNKNYFVPNEKSIWPDIEADLTYALNNLQETPYGGAVGRATKFTAMAVLAKAYMFQQKYSQAGQLLEILINTGPFKLSDYHKNFNPATRNGEETIFSVQVSVNDGSGGYNGNFGDVLNFPSGLPSTGFSCCGFFSPTQNLVNRFKTDSVTGLPDPDHFNETNVTSDEGVESADVSFVPYTGTLDPRLDWTVGRRGIPYLDWGIHPGKDWVFAQDDSGPFSPKKNVFYKNQEGLFTDRDFWSTGTTSNNINLIRLADVLLWAAEVEVENSGDLNKARDYVNRVRARAADPSNWVRKADGSAAANYKVGLYETPWTNRDEARKAVRFERSLELAMEGHRFFDLVRWGIADIEIKTYLDKEKHRRKYLSDAVFIKGRNEYYPIPQTQIDLSTGPDGIKKMKQNPGYF